MTWRSKGSYWTSRTSRRTGSRAKKKTKPSNTASWSLLTGTRLGCSPVQEEEQEEEEGSVYDVEQRT